MVKPLCFVIVMFGAMAVTMSLYVLLLSLYGYGRVGMVVLNMPVQEWLKDQLGYHHLYMI